MSDSLLVIADDPVSESAKEFRKRPGDAPPYAEVLWRSACLFKLPGARTIVLINHFNDKEIDDFNDGLRKFPHKEVFVINHGDIGGHQDKLGAGLPGTLVAYVPFAHGPEDTVHTSILELARTFNAEAFDGVIEAIKTRQANEWATQKWWLHWAHHKLAHLFLPIDLDLQGWRESDWNATYREEIATAAKARGIEDIMARARGLLYPKKDTDDGLPKLERFLAADPRVRGAVATIRKHLPNDEAGDGIVRKTLALMKDGNWTELQSNDGARIGQFRAALAGLDEAFEELIRCVDACADRRA